jgi:hypothetical protein
MLQLPHNWQAWASGNAINAVIRQVKNQEQRTEVTRHLIRAAFDLGFMTRWSRTAPDLRIEESPRLTWSIGHFQYIYLPLINDRTLRECAEHPANVTTFLVPDDQYWVLDSALNHVLSGRVPTIISTEQFLSLRMLFSSMDAGWSDPATVVHLAKAYNARAFEAGLVESQIIVPASSSH